MVVSWLRRLLFELMLRSAIPSLTYADAVDAFSMNLSEIRSRNNVPAYRFVGLSSEPVMSMDPAGELTAHNGFTVDDTSCFIKLTAEMTCGRLVGLLRPMSPHPILHDVDDARYLAFVRFEMPCAPMPARPCTRW